MCTLVVLAGATSLDLVGGENACCLPFFSSFLALISPSKVTLVTLFYLRLVPHTHFPRAYALVSCASGSLLFVLQDDEDRLVALQSLATATQAFLTHMAEEQTHHALGNGDSSINSSSSRGGQRAVAAHSLGQKFEYSQNFEHFQSEKLV